MKTLTPGFSSPKRKVERARAGLTSEDGAGGQVQWLVLNVTLTAIWEMKTLTPGFSSPKRKAERARAGLTSEDGLDQHVAAGLKDLHDSSRKGVPVLLEPSARVVRHLHTSHQPRHHLMVFTFTIIEYDPYLKRIRLFCNSWVFVCLV